MGTAAMAGGMAAASATVAAEETAEVEAAVLAVETAEAEVEVAVRGDHPRRPGREEPSPLRSPTGRESRLRPAPRV